MQRYRGRWSNPSLLPKPASVNGYDIASYSAVSSKPRCSPMKSNSTVFRATLTALLLASAVPCPRCRKPMSVLQKKGSNQAYYYCRMHYCLWLRDPCTYNRFVLETWDDEIWEEIVALLSNDTWMNQQLASELSQSADLEKLIRWEKYFYTPEEAQIKLAKY